MIIYLRNQVLWHEFAGGVKAIMKLHEPQKELEHTGNREGVR